MRFTSSLLRLVLLLACVALPATSIRADETTIHTDTCNDNTRHYSVLRVPDHTCTDTSTVDHQQHTTARTPQHHEALDVEWLQGEILGFSVIGLAQIRGGTALLSSLWYAAAVLTPPLLPRHPDYSMRLNYFAITPPFIALGLLNGYLRHDHADNARVVLSNFIGFNLSLLWAQAVWSSPQRFFAVAPTNVPQLDTTLMALRDGASLYVAYRW